MSKTYFIAGGAGFIGSHLVNTIVKQDNDAKIIIYDNFSSGKIWHLEEVKDYQNLRIITGDIKDAPLLNESMKNSDIVYHFASNPDIAKAVTQPDVDFWEGTYLTNNILEAVRINKVKTIIYASGSGVYGDYGNIELDECHSPMVPTSTYGASKLACEALICAYCHMFDLNGYAFRFANVVGPHQTHGVGYDFVKKLIENPFELSILGDGKQSKSYIYVTDVITAMRLLEKNSLKGFHFYNVGTSDYITVNEIAEITLNILGLKNVKFNYSGGDRGWKGDVPIVRLNSDKIKSLNWINRYTSAEAMTKSIKSIYEDAKLNRFGWKQEVK
jgi:UDP-glucose 4-epimerase